MENKQPYEIVFVRLTKGLAVSHESAKAAILAALQRHKVDRAKLTVVLVDDQRIAELNESYLHHSGPTDVLTFNMTDQASPSNQDDATLDAAAFDDSASSMKQLEGEIVISAETAAREAAGRGIRVDSEIALYAVHGALHLLGYDDGLAEEAARMHELEDEILNAVGIGFVYRKGSS